MKKTIFSALAVIAVVTSALAFTTKSTDKVFCANPADQNFCNQPTAFRTLINNGGTSHIAQCVAVAQNAPCSNVTIYESPF